MEGFHCPCFFFSFWKLPDLLLEGETFMGLIWRVYSGAKWPLKAQCKRVVTRRSKWLNATHYIFSLEYKRPIVTRPWLMSTGTECVCARHLTWNLASSGSRCCQVPGKVVAMCRWKTWNTREQNLMPHSPPFMRLVGLGCTQLFETPPVWESLSSANGRQTPRRAVEIAWKRLKRDPDSVVSLAFHCSWHTGGDLAYGNTEETVDANEDKQPCPKVQLAQAWHDGRRKVLINRPIIFFKCCFFQTPKTVNAPNP